MCTVVTKYDHLAPENTIKGARTGHPLLISLGTEALTTDCSSVSSVGRRGHPGL